MYNDKRTTTNENFLHGSLVQYGNISLSVAPPLLLRLNYLTDFWMNCHEVLLYMIIHSSMGPTDVDNSLTFHLVSSSSSKDSICPTGLYKPTKPITASSTLCSLC